MAKIMDRLLLLVYSIIGFAVSVVALLLVSRIIPEREAEDWVESLYGTDRLLQGIVITVSVIILLISLRFLYVALRRGNASSPSIDQRTEFGDIRISVETVENLALKAAAKQRGVKDLRARIRIVESGLDIMLRTVVDGETSLPLVTEEIQRAVKEHVEEITGIPVSSVSVFVANIVQTQTFKSRVE
ncbi:alkaline shock response membrane anchor protein AmaP [Paenibacillus sambharensis]|uniref:Alkaline shock response membrane anchor protein AmaP n=1 Tax=Paenibacillus sambharensis TaxID=1803190 RepID=A0A2W1LPV3_9BACL|nr:alkaline shock response membrane anchor protein AmaP [Paenibacillus sambharensis]PZD93437.1 alkaline shock response membrane anchor protein AmaP [Paenibacillus sambharensis]